MNTPGISQAPFGHWFEDPVVVQGFLLGSMDEFLEAT